MRSAPRPPLLVTGGFIAALLGIIFLEAVRPTLDRPAQAAQPNNAAQRPARRSGDEAGFAMPPLSSFAEVLARPLFSPSRRAPPPSAQPTDPRAANFAVFGVVLTGARRSAFLQHGQPPRVDNVVEGQTVDGWRVEQILPDRVILASGVDRLEVNTKDAPAGPAQGGSSQVQIPRRGATPQPIPQVPPPNLMGLPLQQFNAPQPGQTR